MNPPDDLRAIFFYGKLEDNWIGHQMAEIWKDGVYRPFLPLIKEGTVALDIGANIGLVSLYLSKYFEKIISLEPSEKHFECLNKNLVGHNITNVKPIKKALFIKGGPLPFGGPSDNTTMRSLHTAPWQDSKSDATVECITIDKLFEDEKIERVSLLKLDVEGSETEIVSSDSFARVADKIDCIVGERHAWSGRHPHQLDDALKNNGFSIEKILNDANLFVAKRK